MLQHPYSFQKGRLIVREMTDLLVLDLVEKGLTTDQMVLTIGYDIENIVNPEIAKNYTGEVTKDHYGRSIPQQAHKSINLGRQTSSTKLIIDKMMKLYDEIVNPMLLIRRVTIGANHLIEADNVLEEEDFEQLELCFDEEAQQKKLAEQEALKKEKEIQKALLNVKKKYGKNAILKGMNLEEGAMTVERNKQIGGHKA